MMNFRLIAIGIVTTSLFACQKELTDDALPPYCAPSQITLSSSGTVLAQFNVDYDTVNRRASAITYNSAGGSSGTFAIQYSGDTIRLSNGTVMVTDVTKRIRYLNEVEGLIGGVGEYFYAYNQAGQLTEKTYDDGINELERYNFSYTNESLSTYTLDALGQTNLLSGVMTYGTSPRITDFALLQYFEVLPELMPYAMLVEAGLLSVLPLETHVVTTNIPGQPPLTFTSNYSGYSVNTDGFPTAYQASVPTGQPGATVTVAFSIDYRCIN